MSQLIENHENTYCLHVVLEEAWAQSGFELVGEVFLPQAQFTMSAISERVQQTSVSTEKHQASPSQRKLREPAQSEAAAVLTCDDSRVVFSTGHLTDTPLFEVLDGLRQPRLEDERPVAELPELPETEREHVVL